MRVLFCLNGPDEINGPNVWLTRHLPLLRRHGIEPRVLYIALNPDEPCRFRAALESQGIGSRAIRHERFTEDGVRAIVAALAAERPDVFVPNYSAAAYYACRFAREAGVRTIGILHSDDPYYHDILDVFVRGAEPWRLDGVVAVSAYLHALALEAATPATTVLHATYGAPLTDVAATEPEDTLTLMYVGRLVERQKRIRRVTDRLRAATRAVPGVRAVLYGDGADRAEIEATLAADEARNVRLGGALPPEAMMPALARGHALVLLSDFEGLSVALMEAMACGVVPIVSATRSGTADLIRPDVNALVVDPDCEAAFVDAVRRLRDEPGLWRRLSAAARYAIAAGGYTADECAGLWAGFCRHLIPHVARTGLEVPQRADLFLPPRCTTPFGLRVADRRDPGQLLRLAMREGRSIYAWGAGSGGQQFLASDAAKGITVAGVIDRRAPAPLRTLGDVPIYPPDRLAKARRESTSPFVVITSMYEDEIARTLEDLGFHRDRDFISA